jgi:hypothetical protein
MATTGHLTVVEGGDTSTYGGERWASKARKEAQTLAGRLDTDYIELARLLYQIFDAPVNGDEKNPPVWTQWGHGSFNEYVEDELGIHRKRAQRLRAVWYHIDVRLKGQIDDPTKERLIQLGFSKVRELVRVLTPRNISQWVEKAEELSYPKLCKSIAKYREDAEKRQRTAREEAIERDDSGEAGEPAELTGGAEDADGVSSGVEETPVPNDTDEDMKPLRFMAYLEQADIIEAAIERAQSLSGSNVRTNNLHLICTDFLATNDCGKMTIKQKLRYVSKIEGLLGLKLVAFDDGDVLYGLETLKNAADDQ